MPPDAAPVSPGTARATARAHWEVLAALAILIGVLLVIDAGSLRRPTLALSFAPLVFLVLAALFPVTLEMVAGWMAAFAGLALTSGDTRYAGLAYPAVVIGTLLLVQRRRGRPERS